MRAFFRGLRDRFRQSKRAQTGVAAVPALAGMALVSLGAGLIYLPAGLIVAGILCIRIDSRL
jgi:hypothetical protein